MAPKDYCFAAHKKWPSSLARHIRMQNVLWLGKTCHLIRSTTILCFNKKTNMSPYCVPNEELSKEQELMWCYFASSTKPGLSNPYPIT